MYYKTPIILGLLGQNLYSFFLNQVLHTGISQTLKENSYYYYYFYISAIVHVRLRR